MEYPIVLDIETQNTFRDVGAYDPTLLSVSLVGIYDYRTDKYESFLEDELEKLWARLERASFIIGFNSTHFDIPVLNRYYTGDLGKLPSFDILIPIKEALGRGVRLEELAQGTLKYGKTGSGLDAVTFFRDKNFEALRDYCLSDVKITKEIYEYGKEHGLLKYTIPGGVREVKVDFRPAMYAAKINFTLPF